MPHLSLVPGHAQPRGGFLGILDCGNQGQELRPSWRGGSVDAATVADSCDTRCRAGPGCVCRSSSGCPSSCIIAVVGGGHGGLGSVLLGARGCASPGSVFSNCGGCASLTSVLLGIGKPAGPGNTPGKSGGEGECRDRSKPCGDPPWPPGPSGRLAGSLGLRPAPDRGYTEFRALAWFQYEEEFCIRVAVMAFHEIWYTSNYGFS